MKINFFEEFPSEENLSKAKFLDFSCIVFIAAKSLSEFLNYKDKLKEINPLLEAAYWPILKESYWISPFSGSQELRNLYNDLKDNQSGSRKVLLDLELPLRKKRLFFTNLFSFSKNKKIIKSIFENTDSLGIEIYTAEYPLKERLLSMLGLSFSVKKYRHKRIPMYYSSVLTRKWMQYCLVKIVASPNKENTHIALGVIARGIFGTESILSAENLEKDMELFKNKAGSVTIFRLGGLNEEYIDIIKKYQSNS